jgi:hypothetical protein
MCYCHSVWYLLKLDVVEDLLLSDHVSFFLTNLSFMCLKDSGIYLCQTEVLAASALIPGSGGRR